MVRSFSVWSRLRPDSLLLLTGLGTENGIVAVQMRVPDWQETENGATDRLGELPWDGYQEAGSFEPGDPSSHNGSIPHGLGGR